MLEASLAFNIEVDYGIEDNKKFSIITLKHNEKFKCNDKFDINNKNILIECIVNSIPNSSFPKNSTDFFEIYTEIKNYKFYIYIKPKKMQKLFANSFDLKKDIAIPKERPKESKIWQIIGYNDEIPFLSNNSYSGLNFPINIPNTTLPYIKELNIDASPLVYDEGPDLAMFLSMRSFYDNNNFAESVRLADEILTNYPDSIFKRESLLYKIRSLSKNSTIPEDMIELAKEWVKSYPADVNIPEILYILGDSYNKLRIYNEARYYFNRILDEYEDSKYAQYALVGLAKILYANGDKKQPESLYAKAYGSAKDLDTASYVSLAWGKYELQNNNTSNANELFNKVVKNNPNYFLKNPTQSYNDFKNWAENKLYNTVALAGDSMLKHLQNNELKKQLMIDVGVWYELDNKIQDAYRVNNEFLNIFKDSKEANSIKERNDNLLFSLNENDLEKQIKQYDYIIKTYPNTDNAKLAYTKKAKNLFSLGKYNEVLALKQNLESNNENIKQSYIKLIESSDDCNTLIKFFLESNEVLITNNSKQIFNCLFNASLFIKAKNLSGEILKQNTSNINDKFIWLYNEARVNFALNDFNKAISSSRDALSLAKSSIDKIKIGSILFLSLANANRKDEAIKVFNELIKINLNTKDMIKPYYQMLLWAINDNDSIATQSYAKALINLQNQNKLYEYSPFVELSYADVLFKDNRFNEMLKVLENIKYSNNNELQKIKYMRGVAYTELGNNNMAKKEFEECIKLDSNSNFGSLCNEGLK
ncbi:tetratricopeptide repeat protein [Helicobacter sp. MIT 14-3879]|uniref:DUF7494 domain-containing protein n=1 Tax=Helicobacter sp. MIT 14-3879 TaxID=2040649 RepID=UPI000E1E40E4|nr:tetratricopeptide repeat protein [Helicobacter sp. MIT 14-3879]RDU63949.1 hypothetical protein CQA44_04735 [Helicobacter sp. MIT 14-3879]